VNLPTAKKPTESVTVRIDTELLRTVRAMARYKKITLRQVFEYGLAEYVDKTKVGSK